MLSFLRIADGPAAHSPQLRGEEANKRSAYAARGKERERERERKREKERERAPVQLSYPGLF